MFLAAAQYLPSVRHSVNHRRRPRLSARIPHLYGDEEMALGNSDATEPSRHHALVLDPQVSRSRQGRAPIH
jgi:hypothetical protein